MSALETLTSISVDTSTGIVTYIDEDLQPTDINIAMLVDSFETVTSVAISGDTAFVYRDEDNNETLIDIRDIETLTTVTNTVAGNLIATYTDEDGVPTDINETITDLRIDGQNIIYTPEDGLEDTISVSALETLTSITVDTSTGIVTYFDEDLQPTDIDIALLVDSFETVTSVAISGDTAFVYRDEDNNETLIDIRDIETLTTVTNTVAGNLIATYTDEDGVPTDINETITDLRIDGQSIIYTPEDGLEDTISVSALETLTSISVDTSTGIVTYIDEDLQPTDIDIAMLVDSFETVTSCLLYTSPSPRDLSTSRMPSSA